MKDKKLLLFDESEVEEVWRKEWEGMPEFKMGNTEEYQKITIRFKSFADVKKLGELIGQKLTHKTDNIWFPKQDDYIAPKNFLYTDEP